MNDNDEELNGYLSATDHDPRTYAHYANLLNVAKDTGHITGWDWADSHFRPPQAPATLPDYATFYLRLNDEQLALVEARAVRAFLTALLPEHPTDTQQGQTHD